MGIPIRILNAVFYPLFLPLEGVRPDYAILAISAVTGVVMLYLYRWTSNQAGLKAVQASIKAHILEIQLYKTDLRLMLRSLLRVSLRNLAYLRLLLLPALLLVAIVVVIVMQCYPRFQYRPVAPGEAVLVKAVLKKWGGPDAPVILHASKGVKVEAGPLAVPEEREVDWRVSAEGPGEHELTFMHGGEEVTVNLLAGEGLRGVVPARAAFGLSSYMESPLAVPLDGGSAFESVEVRYPVREMGYPLLLGMGWVVYFFVASFVVALVWKLAARVH